MQENAVDEADTAGAEAQSSENESDPDLDLSLPTSRVGNTFCRKCGECVAMNGRQESDCVCCFDYVHFVEKFRSASNDCR